MLAKQWVRGYRQVPGWTKRSHNRNQHEQSSYGPIETETACTDYAWACTRSSECMLSFSVYCSYGISEHGNEPLGLRILQQHEGWLLTVVFTPIIFICLYSQGFPRVAEDACSYSQTANNWLEMVAGCPAIGLWPSCPYLQEGRSAVNQPSWGIFWQEGWLTEYLKMMRVDQEDGTKPRCLSSRCDLFNGMTYI